MRSALIPLRLTVPALVLAFVAAALPAARAADSGTTSDAVLPGSPAGPAPAAAEAATPDGGDSKCDVPPELIHLQDPLPGVARALQEGSRPLTIVVLGSLSAAAKAQADGVAGFASELQARLQAEFAARALAVPLKVETVGRRRALAGKLAVLVEQQVLPLEPVLVIWQVGRADARQGNPPHRFGQSLDEGLETLRRQGIDTIVADIQFHPQFEALYRTDDYRHYVRWIAGKHDLPLLRRHEMIEHWAVSGRIDLDSASDAEQRAAFEFIQECLALHAARMIADGAGRVRR